METTSADRGEADPNNDNRGNARKKARKVRQHNRREKRADKREREASKTTKDPPATVEAAAAKALPVLSTPVGEILPSTKYIPELQALVHLIIYDSVLHSVA